MLFAQQQRKNIIEKIRNTFVETAHKDLTIDKGKLVSEICMIHGSTRRKALEYIQEIKDSGFIVEDNGELWLSDKFKLKTPEQEFSEVLKP